MQKARFGFYLFILESLFDIDSKIELEECIFDTNYNVNLLGKNGNDNKVDCIYIDEEDKKIYVMNFKYREKFKEDNFFEYSEVDSTISFLSLINDDKFNSKNLNNEKLQKIFDNIRSIVNDSTQIYDIYFYFISNENKTFPQEFKSRIESLERDKGIIIEQLSLEDIYNFGNNKVKSTSAKLLIESDKISLFKNDSYTTNNSYVMNINLFELLRITCDKDEYRNSTDLKGKEEFDLSSLNQERSQLRDNVRSFLGFTNYNTNIKKTLQNDVSNFFYYNNGITIVCNQIIATESKTNKLYTIELNDMQIVNGGQTIATLFKIVESNDILELLYKLKNTYILVRAFNIANDDELKLNIAQYTNSQNSIDKIDLKSVDKVQLEIEEYFKAFSIEYIRKRGTVSNSNQSIKMITLAQLIYSFKGYPDRASNQKKRLFDDYYDFIFAEDFDVESCKKLFDLYIKITNCFEKLNKEYEISELYYVLYILSKKYQNFKTLSLENIDEISFDIMTNIIDFIEDEAEKYIEYNNNSFAISRVYIKKGFKEQIDNNLKSIIVLDQILINV